ncbi:MAG TPA: chorismate mutase [Kiritimatiellia bacterium]|nr:chorismate mutase [Kiritimatiellia bacterium]
MSKTLDQLRAEIDRLDDQIIRLLNERAEKAVEIGHIKKKTGDELYVPSRERTVLNRLMNLNQGPLSHRSVCRIYREIMASALALEHKEHIIAGGTTRSNLTHAVHFLSGVHAEATYYSALDQLVGAFAGNRDALMVITDEWRNKIQGSAQAQNAWNWFGCWSIVSPETGQAVRYHVIGHTKDHVMAGRPAVVYCLYEKDRFDPGHDSAEWCNLPVASMEFTALLDQPDQGLLKINLDVSTKDIDRNFTTQIAGKCLAVWVA